MAKNAKYTALGFMTIAANLLLVFFSTTLHHDELHAENALLENIQAACLALCALAYLFFVSESQDQRLIQLAVALLCFSFLLRELDLERLEVPALLQVAGSGKGRAILLASLWLWLGSYAWMSIRSVRDFVQGFLRSRIFLALSAAFCLLLVSAAMDKNIFGIEQSRLFEELLETNAYLLIALPLFAARTRAAESGFRLASLSKRG